MSPHFDAPAPFIFHKGSSRQYLAIPLNSLSVSSGKYIYVRLNIDMNFFFSRILIKYPRIVEIK